MTENPGVSEWSAARGEKWVAQLAGMEATLKPVDEPLIRALRLDGPYRICEIGCGGGGTTLAILCQAQAGSAVHGFDISPALIHLARTREGSDHQGSDHRGLAFDVADMATVTAPEAYDRLVSRFGVMFFDDPPAAFSNLVQWLAPGGRFAFAVWGHLADNAWMTTVRDVVAEVVEIASPAPDAPGPFRYGEAENFLVLLKRAGFDDLQTSNWRGALPIGGGLPAAEAAKFALASFASFSELLSAAGGEAFSDAQRLLTERFARHEHAGIVQLGASVHIVTGARVQ